MRARPFFTGYRLERALCPRRHSVAGPLLTVLGRFTLTDARAVVPDIDRQVPLAALVQVERPSRAR